MTVALDDQAFTSECDNIGKRQLQALQDTLIQ